MDTSRIKTYATQARRDFLKAVTERANYYGIFDDVNIESMTFKGDVALIGNQALTEKEGKLRERLVERVKKDGFEMTMRKSAYTWFNRFVALRYMELHDFLGHGYRVLSSPDASGNSNGHPEILSHAAEIDLPGLKKELVVELRLAGDKDNELYRLLLIAQCNDLHRSMPFLFEPIDSETELLLPDNLLHSDSPIRKLVTETPESDWQDVEIIGWIYQFYISEKKDQVIGKVVKSEDIPAATQLFTPNWIVKYMVQNTLGRMWLATYPESALRDKMDYYIEPAEQEPEVQQKLDEITPTELNPEEITFMDPACGSGHILVEAYDVLKEIYLERGYRTREIPRLILEKNLYGLDIDDRAAQLAGFAVLMRARKDDRKILSRDDLTLNIMAIQSSGHMDAQEVAKVVVEGTNVKADVVVELIKLFENAKTFGSLISVSGHIAGEIENISGVVNEKLRSADLFAPGAARQLLPILRQTEMLARKYDCVVTNPPYMGTGGMNEKLKKIIGKKYPDAKSDLMTCFIDRCVELSWNLGLIGMIVLPSWLFLGSFEKFRYKLLKRTTIISLIHLGRGMFGADFGSVAFVIMNYRQDRSRGIYKRLFVKQSEVASVQKLEKRFWDKSYGMFIVNQNEFLQLPGYPIGYWISPAMRKAFIRFDAIEKIADSRIGMATGRNDYYIRCWHEVCLDKIGFKITSREQAVSSEKKWFPHAKGGEYRKWYGNSDHIVNWQNDGHELQTTLHPSGKRIWAHNFNLDRIFKPAICWTTVTIADTSFRYYPEGYLYDAAAGLCQPKFTEDIWLILGALNSCVSINAIKLLNPTVNLAPGYLGRIPVEKESARKTEPLVRRSVNIAHYDWNSYEISWEYVRPPLLYSDFHQSILKDSYHKLRVHWNEMISEMTRLEEENNRIFIEAYGLEDELTPDVPLSEITLTCNPYYRYGANKTKEELEALQRTDTMKELISYAIGCMMGRYSLDEPGLIYAHSGNEGFDPSRYKTFPADDDGIIPIMDMDWFPDDATNRFVEFLKVAWSPETLDENLKFIADSLNPKRNEDPKDNIRRYLSTSFFKDHMRMYKKRPIYWLFSSGKQKAFECLVYLHRYNETTLSRMRSSYVTPLQGNIRARIEFLQHEKDAATSASDQRKIQKELENLKKKQAELSKFDDELRHFADMRISLDLDDGVKVNYGKFGNLLAESKAITGEK